MSRSVPAALAVSYVVLRILVVLNWIYGAIVAAILAGMFTAPGWTMQALGIAPADQSATLMIGMRIIPVLGLLGVPLNLLVLHRLLAMVGTVRRGDPFVADNAYRLLAIAWAVLGQQLLQLAVGVTARLASTPAHQLRMAAFSPGGWLAVILLFVLARVFAEGALMREDLDGMV